MDINSKVSTIDDTILIPLLSAGDKLYHYTSVEGLKGICEGEFWITERSFLNDFTEFQVATEIFKEVLDKHMKDKYKCEIIKELVATEVNRLQDPSLDKESKVAYTGDYIISFCLDWDSPLMWSEYSNFSGYCMAFDFEKLVNSFRRYKESGIMHGRVIYKRDEQLHLMEKSIEHIFEIRPTGTDHLKEWKDFDTLGEDNMEAFVSLFAVVVSCYNMFFKRPCFEGEREYRFIFMSIHDGGNIEPKYCEEQHFRIREGVLIPFIKEPLLSLEALERVMIGAKNKNDITVKGLRHFFRNLKLDVLIEESRVPLRY